MQRKQVKDVDQLIDALFEACENCANGQVLDEDIELAKKAETTIKALNIKRQRQIDLGIRVPIKGLDDSYLDKNQKLDKSKLLGVASKEKVLVIKNKSLIEEFTKPNGKKK